MTLALSPDVAPASTPARPAFTLPPLARVVVMLVGDLVSTLVFAGVYAATGSVAPAFALAVVAGMAGVAWSLAKGHRVQALQWMSLGLVIFTGLASLVTHDPRFVLVKPTIAYVLVGFSMLQPGWMTRYMPPVVLTHGADLPRAFGYVWAASMFALATANLVLVLNGDRALWVAFLATVPLGLKFGLAGLQYVATRMVVRRRVRAKGGL